MRYTWSLENPILHKPFSSKRQKNPMKEGNKLHLSLNEEKLAFVHIVIVVAPTGSLGRESTKK